MMADLIGSTPFARKRTPTKGKIRTREHVIADLAVNHLERHILMPFIALSMEATKMPDPHIKFAELREILLQLGYEQRALPEGFLGFQRGEPDTLIALPAYKNGEIMAPRHLASVRVMLANQRVITADEFDQLLASASIKHSAS